jgi:hypothetical protein
MLNTIKVFLFLPPYFSVIITILIESSILFQFTHRYTKQGSEGGQMSAESNQFSDRGGE